MAITFPRVFAALTAPLLSYLDENFNAVNAALGAASGIAPLDASSKIVSAYGGSPSGIATLDGSSKVVQDPANATATPAASKIPISDGTGKLAAGWINNAGIGTATPAAAAIPLSGADSFLASRWLRLNTYLNADATTTSDTLVTAMALAIPGAGTYEFEANFIINNTGWSNYGKLALAYSGTTTWLGAFLFGVNNTTVVYEQYNSIGVEGASYLSNVGAVVAYMTIKGTIQVTTSGTFALQYRRVTNGVVTMQRGANLTIRKIA